MQTTRSRADWILSRVTGGRVLDLGCIDERHPERISTSLHAAIRRSNPLTVGMDLDRHGIEVVRQLGFEVAHGDAQSSDLGGPYDVIVAAELIEHLDDPGRFLDNVAKSLAPNGRLLLTTPNPFDVKQLFRILRRGEPQVHGEHRCWFDPKTLRRLLTSRGFEVAAMTWIAPRSGVVRKALARLRPYLCAGFAVEAVRRS